MKRAIFQRESNYAHSAGAKEERGEVGLARAAGEGGAAQQQEQEEEEQQQQQQQQQEEQPGEEVREGVAHGKGFTTGKAYSC